MRVVVVPFFILMPLVSFAQSGEELQGIYQSAGEIQYRVFKKKRSKLASRFVEVDCSEDQIPVKVKTNRKGKTRVRTYSSLFRKLRNRLKKQFGNLKSAPLKQRSNASFLKVLSKSTICDISEDQGEPTETEPTETEPGQSPSPIAVPSPDPIRTPNTGPNPMGSPSPTPPLFGLNGDVTDYGKELFEIPLDLPANRDAGEQKYNNTCFGCHEPRGDSYPFSALQILTLTVMNLSIADEDLADITAYLNRTD